MKKSTTGEAGDVAEKLTVSSGRTVAGEKAFPAPKKTQAGASPASKKTDQAAKKRGHEEEEEEKASSEKKKKKSVKSSSSGRTIGGASSQKNASSHASPVSPSSSAEGVKQVLHFNVWGRFDPESLKCVATVTDEDNVVKKWLEDLYVQKNKIKLGGIKLVMTGDQLPAVVSICVDTTCLVYKLPATKEVSPALVELLSGLHLATFGKKNETISALLALGMPNPIKNPVQRCLDLLVYYERNINGISKLNEDNWLDDTSAYTNINSDEVAGEVDVNIRKWGCRDYTLVAKQSVLAFAVAKLCEHLLPKKLRPIKDL